MNTKRRIWANRVEETTVAVLDQLAFDLGYKRVTGEPEAPRLVGSTGQLLDAIASGEIRLCTEECMDQREDEEEWDPEGYDSKRLEYSVNADSPSDELERWR